MSKTEIFLSVICKERKEPESLVFQSQLSCSHKNCIDPSLYSGLQCQVRRQLVYKHLRGNLSKLWMHTCNLWMIVFLTWVFRNAKFCHIVLQESYDSRHVNEQVCTAEKWRFFFAHCLDYGLQGSNSWTSGLPTLQELEQTNRNRDESKLLSSSFREWSWCSLDFGLHGIWQS